jgi:peptidyl-prolyl cis-trans isomerase B (cyclophilin B)
MHQDYPGLDGEYAAFGWITSGIEIVDAICADANPTDNNGTIPKSEQPVIETIRVTEVED